jgi:hypothetical protein
MRNEFGFAGSVTEVPAVFLEMSIGTSVLLLVAPAQTVAAVVPVTFTTYEGLYTGGMFKLHPLGTQSARIVAVEPACDAVTVKFSVVAATVVVPAVSESEAE